MGARGILQYGRLRVVRDLSQIREDNMFDQDMYNRPQNMPQQPYGANMNNTLPQPMNGMNNNRIPSLQASMMTPNISASSFMPGTGDNGGTPSYRRGGGIRGYMHGGQTSGQSSREGAAPPLNLAAIMNAMPRIGGRGRRPDNLNMQPSSITNQGNYGVNYDHNIPSLQDRKNISGYDNINHVLQQRINNQGQQMASGGSVNGLSDLMEILKAAQEGEQVHNQIPQYAHGGHVPGYKFGGKIGKALGKVVGVAAPFIGAAVGGPGGAAIGGALGGAMQGGNRKKILKNAAIGAGLGYAGSGGFGELGGIGKIIPSVNAGVGGMMNGQGFSAFSNPFAGGVGAGGVAGANVAGQVAGQNKETPAPGGIGGMLAKAAPWLLGGAVLGTAFGKNKVPYEEPLGVRVAESGMHHKHEPFREARPTDRIARILADDELGVGRAPQFFEDVNPETQYYAAKGGLMRHMANGGYLDGHTGGQDDDIDAKLSDGEYVLSADVVSGLGDGNNRHGAKKIDKFMSNVRSHKYAKGGKGLPPKAKSLESYMKSRRA